MTLKGDAKFKRKLTCGLKNNLKNLLNFLASNWKSRNLHCDGLLLSKAYKDLDEQYRRVVCHDTEKWYKVWRKNWLLIPKSTWGIWWILMWAVANLKICTLMCYFFVNNIYKVSAKKSTEELSLMALKRDPNFEEKLSFCLKNDIWGIWWTLTGLAESLKICTLMGYFSRNYVLFELKKYRGVVSRKVI